MIDLMTAQLERERTNKEFAQQKAEAVQAYMNTSGNAAASRHFSPLISRLIGTVADQLTTDVKSRKRRTAPMTLTAGHDHAAMAAVALIVSINRVVSRGSMTQAGLSMAIGKEIQDDMMFTVLRKEHRGLYETIRRRLGLDGPSFVARSHRMQMTRKNVEWEWWTPRQTLLVGLWCVNALYETGVLTLPSRRSAVCFTEEFREQVDALSAWQKGRIYNHSPMLVPPIPWTSLFDGGFLEPIGFLVQGRVRRRRVSEFQDGVVLPSVLDAVNAVQDTAWQVNPLVVSAIRHAVEKQLETPILPDFLPLPLPGEYTGEENTEEHRDHRDAVRDTLRKNSERSAGLGMVTQVLDAAEVNTKYDRIYFVHRLDWRGRMYPATSGLNPQGTDYSKSPLRFADAEPIDTPEARKWLGVHVANTFGEDKLSLDDRVRWAEDAVPAMRRAVADPNGDRWWQDADKPLAFLAAAEEWVGLEEHGLGYPSKVPVAMDGTCNGLQHLSALLRDSTAAGSVNLLPADLPSDIYRDVAEAAVRRMHRETDPKKKAWADGWLALGITRKTTKRAVMVVPYGGTLSSCRAYIREWYEEHTSMPWGQRKDFVEPLTYLTDVVWTAIAERIPAARSVMDWLQDVVKIVVNSDQPIIWETPDGWTCYQHYPSRRKATVNLWCMGGRKTVQYNEEDPTKSDVRKSVNAFAPNFTHSLDASHLRMTVLAARAQGVRSFGMVHDSFGTHARHAPLLARALREQFVRLYDENDPVQDLIDAYGELGLPDPPPRGDYDLNAVLRSTYFFS